MTLLKTCCEIDFCFCKVHLVHNVEVYPYRLHEQFLQQLIYPLLLLMVHLKQSSPICGNFDSSCCEFQ